MSSSPLILVVNCGSSSIKFAVMAADSDAPVLSGLAECLGLPEARIIFKADGQKTTIELSQGTHEEALDVLVNELTNRSLIERISAVGHRVVHGGNRFSQSTLVTPEVIEMIEAVSGLAPLHNPANLTGIRAAMKTFPALPQVAVFDTAFHQTLEPAAYTYALPYKYLREYDVRRYGFHGTSHRFVSGEAVRLLNLDPKDHGIVIAHLGNGSSACAVRNGISVDTTMGLTPLEGLVMGTRSGDVDFGALAYIAARDNLSVADLDRIVNKESGLLGLSELSSDCRTLEDERANGHAGATLAIDVFVHRLARHIGGLATSLHRLDAVVFTGGIGENSSLIRKLTLEHLAVLGFKVDEAKNADMFAGRCGVITLPSTPTAIVIATNEEKMIVQDVVAVTSK